MPRTARPRKVYRPRPVHNNAVQVAITGASKLPSHLAAQQMATVRTALAEFTRGLHCAAHWRSLADAANVAESLCAIGIGGGPDAQRLINQAQAALHHVDTRHANGRSWTLYAGELDALQWLLTLHHMQLGACTATEFERAYQDARKRIAQARAGNAPAGAVIVEGEIA